MFLCYGIPGVDRSLLYPTFRRITGNGIIIGIGLGGVQHITYAPSKNTIIELALLKFKFALPHQSIEMGHGAEIFTDTFHHCQSLLVVVFKQCPVLQYFGIVFDTIVMLNAFKFWPGGYKGLTLYSSYFYIGPE